MLGEQIEMITADDYCDGEQAVAAANKLVADGVVAVFGHQCSGAAIPASKIYADAGILMISTCRHQPEAHRAGPHQRVPDGWPGRSSGPDRRRSARRALEQQADRHPPRRRRPTAKASRRRPRNGSTSAASPRRCSKRSSRARPTTRTSSRRCGRWASRSCTSAVTSTKRADHPPGARARLRAATGRRRRDQQRGLRPDRGPGLGRDPHDVFADPRRERESRGS